MSGKNEIGAKIVLDGEKEFKNTLSDIGKRLTTMNSEMKKVEEEFRGQANTVEALSKKQEVLNKILQEQQKKVEASEKGLEHAKEAYDKIGDSLTDLWTDLEKATDQLEDLEKIYGESSEEAAKQREEVEKLQRAIAQGEQSYRRAGNQVKDWETKLNQAETEVLKTNRALNENERYLEEASNSADGCAKSIDKFGKEVKDSAAESKKATGQVEDLADEADNAADTMEDLANEVDGAADAMENGADHAGIFGEVLAGSLASDLISNALDGIKDGIVSLAGNMLDLDSASHQLAASVGATEAELESYREIMGNIADDDFGEDFDDIEEAMEAVLQSFDGLNETDLTNITENAIALKDVFGYEYKDSLNAIKGLMQNFGVTAEQAYNLIVQGAQNGIDQNDNMLDTLNEYGPKFAAMGFSAEEMFNSLANGVEAGIFDVDKLGDAINEFSIRVKDGTADNAFKDLNLDAAALKSAFGEGGAAAQSAFQTVITELRKVEDPLEQNRIGVELFGSMWEDTGGKAILALQNTNGGISATKNAMEELKQIKYDDVVTSFSNLGDAIEKKFLTPIRDTALPVIKAALDSITEAIDPPKTALEQFLEDITKANEQARASIEQANATVGDAQLKSDTIDRLTTRLIYLNEVENKTTKQRYELRSAVSALSSQIPELANAYDEEKGAVNLTTAEIHNLADAKKELLMTSAVQAANSDILSAIATATINLQRAKEAYAAAAEETSSYSSSINALKNEMRAAEEIGDWIKADQIRSRMSILQEGYSGALKRQAEANAGMVESQKIIDDGQEHLDAYTEVLNNLTRSTSENTEAQEENNESALKAVNISKELADSPKENFEKSAKAAEESSKAQKAALESLHQKYNEVRESILQSIQNKINPYDIFEGGTDMITENMNANMEANIKTLQEYQANLEKLEQLFLDGLVGPEYFKHLLDLGIDGANELGHVINTYNIGDFAELERLSDNFAEQGNEAENASDKLTHLTAVYTDYISTLGSSQEEFDNLQSSFDEMVQALEEEGKSLDDSVKSAFQSMIDAARKGGIEIPKGLSEGIKSGELSIDDATAQIEGAIRGKFEHLAEIAEESGIEIPDALIDAIEAGGPGMADALNSFTELIAGGNIYAKLRKAMSGAAKAVGDSGDDFSVQAQKVFSELINSAEKYGAEIDGALISGLQSGSMSLSEATDLLGKAVTDGIAKITEDAEKLGVELPEGFKSGVEEGNIYTEEAMEILDAAIKEKSSELTETMKDLGMEIPSELQAGIDAGGSTAVQAIKDMNALIEAEQNKGSDTSKKAGEKNAEAQAEGTKSKESVAVDAGKSLGQSGANGAASTQGSYQSAGATLGSGLVWGLAAQSGSVYDAGVSLGRSGSNGANAQYSSYYSAGSNLSAGLAAGILSGASSVIDAAIKVAKSGIEAAKLQLGMGMQAATNSISSEIAQEIKDGMESIDQKMNSTLEKAKKAILQGSFTRTVTSQINNHFGVSLFDANGAKKSAEKYYAEIYNAAAKWLSDYKKQNGLTLEEEEKFWQMMTSQVQKGTQAYYQVQANLSSAKFRQDISNPLKNNFDVKRTDENGKEKDADKYYDDLMKAANDWLENYKVTHDVSLQYESYYWQQVQKKVQQGSQAWYDAQKKINDLQKQQQKELLSASQTALDQYKTYYKVSEYAEVQYWNIVRKQFQEGTEERIEADQKYFEAKQAYNDKLIELNEEYVKSSDEVKNKLKEQTKELRETYDNAVKERAQSIYDSFGLFDDFYSESDSGAVLLNNLKNQVAGYADWELQLEELKKKGIKDGLLEELQEMGPQASASLHALNSLTAEQLEEYQQLWQQKHDLAQSQSVKENENLRKETEEEIKKLTEEARQEILDLREEYLKAMEEVKATIEQPLKNLAANTKKIGEDVTAQLIAGITSGATKNEYTVELQKSAGSVTEALKDIPKTAKTIGEDALKELLDGLTDKEKIEVQAKMMIDQLSASMKAAAEQDQILQNLFHVTESQSRISSQKIEEELSSVASTSQMDSRLNQIAVTESSQQQRVYDPSIADLMYRIFDLMQDYLPYLAEKQQVVFDTDQAVEKLQPGISQMTAINTRRRR